MNRITTRTVATTLVTAALLCLYVGASEALHRDTPVVVQVTTAPSQIVGEPYFAYNSTVLLFHSDGDQLGNGNTTPQIFLFDLGPRAKHNEPSLYQLTFGDKGSFHPTSAKRGRIVAFESEADLVGNGSIGKQLFAGLRVKWRRGVVPLVQITRNTGQGFTPVLSGTGKYLVFSSNEDLTEEGLAPGVHLYRSEMRRLVKSGCPGYPCPLGANPGLLLVTREEAFNGAPDRRGERIAFDSRGDAAQNNCANGARQIFVRDFKEGTIQQLTFGTADSYDPIFSRDGFSLFFVSEADLLGNGNARANIFRLNLTTIPFTLEQLTFGTDGDSVLPEPNGRRGDRVFFQSTASLTGAPAGINRIYLYDDDQSIIRLTNGQGINSRHTAQFLFTAFASSGDLVGNGNTLPQMFLVNGFPLLEPPPVATRTSTPTPTPTPIPGEPENIGMALLVEEAGDNGDNTLTTVIAATVSDFFSNPVPDGTFVSFRVLDPTNGAVISNGQTFADPDCDVSRFVEKTGVTIQNQHGVVHVCLTYPGAQSGTQRVIEACAGGSPEMRCDAGENAGHACTGAPECPGGACVLINPPACGQEIFTLPLPTNECATNGQPCSDANPCTVGDVCGGGTPDRICVGGSNEGAPCTLDAQCPDLRLCANSSNPGFPCATNFDCPGGTCEFVSAGSCELLSPPTCQSGTPTVCAPDGDLCTTDACNFFTGDCYDPVFCTDDANPCTDDVCDPGTGVCGVPNTLPCEDGDVCTLDDVCAGGLCQPGPVLMCSDDLNPCTDDVCNPDTGACGIPIPCVCP